MKVVFDTFRIVRRGQCQLCTSVAILTETARVLRKKFDQTNEDIVRALKLIGRTAEIVTPTITLSLLRDEADNRILECAVAAGADLVVTGDRHLLELRKSRGIAIARVADFLRIFPASGR